MLTYTRSTLLLVTLTLFSCELLAQSWEPVLKIDENGEVVSGSKQQLINAIRHGQDVKIAWGWKYNDKSIEHISEPTWTAIINEQEVLFHIDPQVFGAILWDSVKGSFEERDLKQEWRVIIDTNGTFDAVWYDRSSHEVKRRMPQNHKMTWFVRGIREKKASAFFDQ